MTTTQATRDFRYDAIDPDTLSSTDLRTIWGQSLDDGASRALSAYRIWIDDEAQPAEALVIDWDHDDDELHLDYRENRIGIAWGANASWGELFVESDPVTADLAARAIHVWLNDPEAWEARKPA